MAEAKGVKESLELLEGLKLLVVTAKKAMADGKVGLADLPLLVGLLGDVAVLAEAVKGVDQVVAEAKDLSSEELQLLAAKVLELVAAAKA